MIHSAPVLRGSGCAAHRRPAQVPGTLDMPGTAATPSVTMYPLKIVACTEATNGKCKRLPEDWLCLNVLT